MTPSPPGRSATPARVRIAAIVVLVVGWLSAAGVFAVAPADSAPGADGDQVVGGQAYASDSASDHEMQQLERLGGKAAVLTFKFNRRFTSLWSGRPLAWTLAVLAAVVAAGCWRFALLMDEGDVLR